MTESDFDKSFEKKLKAQKYQVRAYLCQGHWQDTPSNTETAWVVSMEGLNDLISEILQAAEEGKEEEFSDAIAQKVSLSDEDVLFYMDKFDKDEVCDGDFKVERVLDERRADTVILMSRILVGYVAEKHYLPMSTDGGIISKNPVFAVGGFCEDDYVVQFYDVEENEWRNAAQFESLKEAKEFKEVMSSKIGDNAQTI